MNTHIYIYIFTSVQYMLIDNYWHKNASTSVTAVHVEPHGLAMAYGLAGLCADVPRLPGLPRRCQAKETLRVRRHCWKLRMDDCWPMKSHEIPWKPMSIEGFGGIRRDFFNVTWIEMRWVNRSKVTSKWDRFIVHTNKNRDRRVPAQGLEFWPAPVAQ